jgi:hypothetical protein
MRRRLLLGLVVGLALTACDSQVVRGEATGPSGDATTPGAQNYESVEDLHAAVLAAGVDCSDLQVVDTFSIAAEQASCALVDDRLILQLWNDAGARDSGASTLIRNYGLNGFCLVVGRGDGHQGAWTVDAGADADICHTLADALGGKVHELVPSQSGTPTATAPPTTTTPSAPTTTSTPPPPAPAPTTSSPPPPPAPAPQPQSRSVVYEIVSDAPTVSVTFTTFTGGQVLQGQDTEATPPWSRTVELRGGSFESYGVLGQMGPGGTTVTCRITMNGNVLVEQTSTGAYAIANCNAS